ncbi:member of major facilitator superfamily multidrug-resistance, DHA1 sub-family [Mycena rebaudengoi]|nr:member of major facilitator superfamily multidrug-resistance, DHA1 sub-family [Mycena rebaudengoi]
MSPRDRDETQPLLAARDQTNDPNDIKPTRRTPLPVFQLSIVLFLQLAEPLTSQVIYPFAPQLIRDIGITNGDETKVGYYVGMMQSLFFLTQALTVLHWSRLSDRIGRKPVILTGLIGLSMSMYCFGLSRTFWGLVLSRSLNGALNGNIGVIKSMVAEMTDATNIAQAYALMPLAWSTGGVLGPIIGGSLAHPVDQWPALFGNSTFLRTYPYFLPCAIPATYSILAWFVTFFFLKETATSRASSRGGTTGPSKGKISAVEASASTEANQIKSTSQAVPLRNLLTRPVIIAASNYAMLSLVDIAFRAIQPLFLSTPIELGGLGLSTSRIGNMLSIFGVLNGLFQVFFFGRVHDYLGSKTMYTLGIASALPCFAMFPLLNYLARAQGLSATVWALVLVQIVVSIGLSFSYGAVFIYISSAAPNRASLGATNGVSQLTVSLMRTIGPAAANSLFSLSMKIDGGYLGRWMVYYVLMAVVCVSLWVGAQLPRRPWVIAA